MIPSPFKTQIEELAQSLLPEMISWRRHLHAHPELSFEEVNTSLWIQDFLKKLDIPYTTGWAGHGVVGILQGNGGNRCIALRADMDALPIQEENTTSYVSTQTGVMHACGHDVHMTALCGAIKILHTYRSEWSGQIKLIFQPGEEKLPGGAKLMIAEGVLENPTPECIIGQHVFTPLQAGHVGFRPGAYMASSDEIYITFTGKGGHAALPAQCVNPILMSSRFLLEMENYIRSIHTHDHPVICSFGKMNTVGGATNVIPGTVHLEGTLRTLDEQLRKFVHQKITTIAQEIAIFAGGQVQVECRTGYPALNNHQALTEFAMQSAQDYLGATYVHPLDIRMTAEDFASYAQVIPGCFYRLGTGNPELGITAQVHHPKFDVDENALSTAAGLMAYLAMSAISEEWNSVA